MHDPNGIIAAALAQRGYNMSHGVEYVSKRLGESEMREIVQEYARQSFPSSGIIAAVDTPPVVNVTIPAPNFPTPTEVPTSGNEKVLGGTSLLLGGAIIAA